eukprot:TRINITY_DN2892_c0_g1_i6.p1 TRINITY_DN2892_c0_g1~~TRINITY_DN2892_c0_g1_i6.p1  ORF type:complete len:379 (+),score=175.36 TRINITY_DN2892_c0_g1_i6:106-1137(+)
MRAAWAWAALAAAPAAGFGIPWGSTLAKTFDNVLDEKRLVGPLREQELAAVVQPLALKETPAAAGSKGSRFPSVTAHGMGDSCFNAGMKQITQVIGQVTGQYSVCIPTGGSDLMDTLNGFFMTMNKNVDEFAKKIKADPQLAGGFNCVGFSQGNSLCRGYIEKYNNPPVKSFVSVHGTLMGVSGFPQCNPSSAICRALAAALGDLAYNKLIQDVLFQADYFRAPKRVSTEAYKKRSQLAQWNGEGEAFNSTYKASFLQTQRFAMVKALGDTMVFPNEGEWWGHFAEGSYEKVVAMKDTEYYKQDTFGLRTLDEQGRLTFNTTTGNHLQFSEQQLFWWADNYFL